MISLAAPFVLALAVLMPTCYLLASRFWYVPKPQEDGCHKRPTALFSGVAIIIITLVAGLTARPAPEVWRFLGHSLLIAARLRSHC
jgi:UDP-N-acetylmuramyl pentapeptide phosphotransferase/UDP-N-acetylglucosamine-1-phosphate transferase